MHDSKNLFLLLVLTILTTQLVAQDSPTRVQRVTNYNSWGWEALVLENGLITTATVPVIGARIMQYDLGTHSSVFVNSDELGKVYTPRSNSGWYNYGGYKVWPAPQDRWGWPPPPIIDFGEYSGEIVTNSPDSVAIFVAGQTEKWKTPDLRMERKITVYRGTSRVKVEQTLINEGSQNAEWSVWDVTQCIVNHPGKRDFENFWVYFPINPESRYGKNGVRVSASSNAWKGEVAPGVYGVQFLPEGKKIFADSHLGWVAYVDELEGVTYVKTFPIYPDQEYPDEGARVEVWISQNPLYLEVEVLSPITKLAASGGRYTFTEDWWATKLNGPILFANNVGAIATRLHLDAGSGQLRATYGVFHEGNAQLVFKDAQQNVLGSSESDPVTPQATFELNATVSIPAGTKLIDVQVKNLKDEVVGVLESANADAFTAVPGAITPAPRDFWLAQNHPNPFNPGTRIQYHLPENASVRLCIFNLTGQLVRTLVDESQPGGVHQIYWDGRSDNGYRLASGIYLYQIEVVTPGGYFQESRKMLLMQ